MSSAKERLRATIDARKASTKQHIVDEVLTEARCRLLDIKSGNDIDNHLIWFRRKVKFIAKSNEDPIIEIARQVSAIEREVWAAVDQMPNGSAIMEKMRTFITNDPWLSAPPTGMEIRQSIAKIIGMDDKITGDIGTDDWQALSIMVDKPKLDDAQQESKQEQVDGITKFMDDIGKRHVMVFIKDNQIFAKADTFCVGRSSPLPKGKVQWHWIMQYRDHLMGVVPAHLIPLITVDTVATTYEFLDELIHWSAAVMNFEHVTRVSQQSLVNVNFSRGYKMIDAENKQDLDELQGFLTANPGLVPMMLNAIKRCFCGSNAKTMKCSRCGITRYCSRECQKADWVVHKLNCVRATPIPPPPPTSSPP